MWNNLQTWTQVTNRYRALREHQSLKLTWASGSHSTDSCPPSELYSLKGVLILQVKSRDHLWLVVDSFTWVSPHCSLVTWSGHRQPQVLTVVLIRASRSLHIDNRRAALSLISCYGLVVNGISNAASVIEPSCESWLALAGLLQTWEIISPSPAWWTDLKLSSAPTWLPNKSNWFKIPGMKSKMTYPRLELPYFLSEYLHFLQQELQVLEVQALMIDFHLSVTCELVWIAN